VFWWRREPDPAWYRMLEALAPRQDRLAHLTVVWEAGVPADPVQRWVIYECVPALAVPDLLARLWDEGLCTCPHEAQVVHRGSCPRCRRPWLPARRWIYGYAARTGTIPQPCWIVQGARGGHAASYSRVDRGWSRLAGLPEIPPAPGSRSYAPFDERVMERLWAVDRLRRHEGSLLKAWQRGEAQAEEQLRRAIVQAQNGAVQEAVEELGNGLPWDDMPVQEHGDWVVPEPAALDDHFIATGQMPRRLVRKAGQRYAEPVSGNGS
jgi:hypothetical protein